MQQAYTGMSSASATASLSAASPRPNPGHRSLARTNLAQQPLELCGACAQGGPNDHLLSAYGNAQQSLDCCSACTPAASVHKIFARAGGLLVVTDPPSGLLRDAVDEQLAAHIDSLASAAAAAAAAAGTERHDPASAQPTPTAAAAAVPSFDAFPPSLRKGARVTQGPSWGPSGLGGGGGGSAVEGTVEKCLKGGRVLVSWDKQPEKLQAVTYNKASGVFDVKLVDPSLSTVRPPPAYFQVGDLVQRLAKFSSTDYDAEKRAWFKTNLVNGHVSTVKSSTGIGDADSDVDADVDSQQDDKAQSSAAATAAAAEAAEAVSSAISVIVRGGKERGAYRLANLQTGTLHEVAFDALHQRGRRIDDDYLYADGSARGNEVIDRSAAMAYKAASAVPQGHLLDKMSGTCPSCNMCGPSKQSSDVWCSQCRQCAVCVAKNKACSSPGGFVIVRSTHAIVRYGQSSTAPPDCSDCGKKMCSSECSEHICQDCLLCAVCCAKRAFCRVNSAALLAAQQQTNSSPALQVFCVGQRVALVDNFAGNGWCLESTTTMPRSDQVIGVVLDAGRVICGKEQRNIVVAPERAPLSTGFRFRASWLKPVTNTGQRVYNIGDRVQLDAANFGVSLSATVGKCLGAPKDARWGVVTALLGTAGSRDGVQRNIQVHLAPDLQQQLLGGRGGAAQSPVFVSLYPSYALLPAVRPLVLTSCDRTSLLQVCSAWVSSSPNCGVDASKMCDERCFGVFETMAAVSDVDFRAEWDASRDLAWPVVCHGCLARYPGSPERSQTHIFDDCPDLALASVSASFTFPSSVAAEAWAWRCGDCGWARNEASVVRCKACKVKGKDWRCQYCSADNRVNMRCCIICARENTTLQRCAPAQMIKAVEPTSAATELTSPPAPAACGLLCGGCNAKIYDGIVSDTMCFVQRPSFLLFALQPKHISDFRAQGKVVFNPVRHGGSDMNCSGCGFKVGKRFPLKVGANSVPILSFNPDQVTVPPEARRCAESKKWTEALTRKPQFKGVPTMSDKDYFSERSKSWSGGCDGDDGDGRGAVAEPGVGAFSPCRAFGVDEKRAEAEGFKVNNATCGAKTVRFPDGIIYCFSDVSTVGHQSIEWEFRNRGGNTLYCGYFPVDVLPPVARGIVPGHLQQSCAQSFKIDQEEGYFVAKLDKKMCKFTVRKAPTGQELFSVDVNVKVMPKGAKLCFAGYNGAEVIVRSGKAIREDTPHSFPSDDTVSLCRVCTSCLHCPRGQQPDSKDQRGRKGSLPCDCGVVGPVLCCSKCGVCKSCALTDARSKLCHGRLVAALGNPLHRDVTGVRVQDFSALKAAQDEALSRRKKALAVASASAVAAASASSLTTYESESEAEDEQDDDGGGGGNGGGGCGTTAGMTTTTARDADVVGEEDESEESYNLARLQQSLNAGQGVAASSASDGTAAEPAAAASLLPLDIESLISIVDFEGSTAAHHCAALGLRRSFNALMRAGSEVVLAANQRNETPFLLLDGVNMADEHAIRVHAICRRLLLFPDTTARTNPTLAAALKSTKDSCGLGEMGDVYEALLDARLEDASSWARTAVQKGTPHAECYYAMALLNDGFPVELATQQLERYETKLAAGSPAVIDPMYFYCRYSAWKRFCKLDSSHKGRRSSTRVIANGMLALCQLFPRLASDFLDPTKDKLDDDITAVLAQKVNVEEAKRLRSCAAGGEEDDDDTTTADDDDVDDDGRADSTSPAALWKMATKDHGAKSPAMDELMQMTGLRRIKQAAVNVFKNVLLSQLRVQRGLAVKSTTTMNFLFVGNPGVGKTTVADKIARIMCELSLRSVPTPVLTTATDLLKGSGSDFEDLVHTKGKGGVVFIDEAYLLKPSPPGSQPNKANEILDALLKLSEELRECTSFILAGYKEEIGALLTYNDGFKSRFPLMFEFEDYTVAEIKRIFSSMVRGRQFRLESKRTCGIDIAKVASERIGKARGLKGFGNARTVRNFVDDAVKRNDERVGTMALMKLALSNEQLQVLTRDDVLGTKPNFSNSPLLQELDNMIGLRKVKEAVRGLMAFQLQNYEAESSGQKIAAITLHRLFLGNPGTGKSSVARIYGQLLREFGLLSNGDVIFITASDLMGVAVGSSAEKTAAFLKQAEGKVLVIDEAYNLDPSRRHGQGFGGDVLDVIVEKVAGSAGADMAIILAGYKDEMIDMIDHSGNPGLRSRFNPEDAIIFEDYSDDELRKILLFMCGQRDLVVTPETANEVIRMVAQQRRLPAFGNARAIENVLGRAMLNKSKRIEAATRSHYAARVARCANEPPLPNRRELVLSDFKSSDDSSSANAAAAKLAFDKLYNAAHLKTFMNELEATIRGALAEGRDPAELLSNSHMVFTGPPGTGKTTTARLFGQIFHQLDLLPTDRVIETTGKNMQGAYVGSTKDKVLELMRQARGGVLFIDEAYALCDSRGTYSQDAVQALVDNITSEEFKGNLLVILAGYESDPSGRGEDIPTLFRRANPGFESRFNKKTLCFEAWTAEQAAEATLCEVRKMGKELTPSGAVRLQNNFGRLAALPKWASARDVFETVLPEMQKSRYVRLAGLKEVEPTQSAHNRSLASSYSSSREQQAVSLHPFTAEDVDEAFRGPLRSRDINVGSASRRHPESVHTSSEAKSLVVLATSADFQEVLRGTATPEASSTNAAAAASTAVVMFSSRRCGPCNAIRPSFLALSRSPEHLDTRFFLVDCDATPELGAALGVRFMPTFLFIAEGSVVDRAVGASEQELVEKLRFCSNAFAPSQAPSTPRSPHTAAAAAAASRVDVVDGDDDGWTGSSRARLGAAASARDQQQQQQQQTSLAPPPPPPAVVYKYERKVEHRKAEIKPGNGGDDDVDFWAALEQAILELGLSLEDVEKMLEARKFPPELLDLLKAITGCDDEQRIMLKCEPQIGPALVNVKRLIAKAKETKTAEEKKRQEKLQKIGKCVMGFDWLRVNGGYQCAGGSHFVSDNVMNSIEE